MKVSFPPPETGPTPPQTEGADNRASTRSNRPALALSASTVERFQDSAEGGMMRKLVAEILEDQAAKSQGLGTSLWDRLGNLSVKLVTDQRFEYVTGLIILLNMVTIGLEAEMSAMALAGTAKPDESSWIKEVEKAFLAIYTVELLLRLLAGGRAIFRSFWFLMDFFLVMVGVFGLLIIPAIGESFLSEAGFEKLLVVRGLRLLRLVRALRMVSHFKVMWRLVHSLLTAGQTMMSTAFLIMLALFIFGCVAVELITHDADLNSIEDTQRIIMQHFPNLFTSILTLLQFVTLDSIAAVYYPLVVHKPWLIVYFALIMLIVSIGLMNLVTAVLVENALENAAVEAEAERLNLKHKIKEALPTLLETFEDLDEDGSGYISRDEIEGVPVTVLPPKLLENVSIDSMVDLFELLDVDGGGQLTQHEFVEGLLNLVLMDVPISTIQSLRLLRSIKFISSQLSEDVKQLNATLLENMGHPVHC